MNMANPVPAPEPARRPGVLTEHGEPLRSPFEAQEIVITPRRDPITGERDLAPVGAAYEKFREFLERKSSFAPAEPEALPPDQASIERLKYLQRWVAKTEHLQQRVDRTQRSIDSYAEHADPKKRKPPQELYTQLATQQARLAEGLERDRIMAERQVPWPGCMCLGLGGSSEVPVVVRDPADPYLVLYSERDGPTSWSYYCPACPEGERAREQASIDRANMRLRAEARKASILLGGARIPATYEKLTLATYPDQATADRVRRWYLANIEGVPADQIAPKVWLLLHGPNRRGKTGLAIGVIKLALERGEEATFRSLKALLDELRATFDRDNPACHSELLAALQSTPLLVIDDLGAENLTNSGWVEETLYGLLNERLIQGKLTIITSNLGWSEWLEPDVRRAALQKRAAPVRSPKDWDPEELIRRVGERIWWRIRAGANQLALLGPKLGVDEPPARLSRRPEPADQLEEWNP